MTDHIKRLVSALKLFIARRWAALRSYSYAALMKNLIAWLDVMPGILAWALEMLSIAAAIGCIASALQLAVDLAVLPAAAMVILAAMFIGLAILTDYYTAPRSNKGGGG